MSEHICGHCINWRCDDPKHMTGHCIINRMDRFHGDVSKNCTKFQTHFASPRMRIPEAIANLNHIYGMVSPDIQRSLDMAIKALEEKEEDNENLNPDTK